jgi:hypothetical protein
MILDFRFSIDGEKHYGTILAAILGFFVSDGTNGLCIDFIPPV